MDYESDIRLAELTHGTYCAKSHTITYIVPDLYSLLTRVFNLGKQVQRGVDVDGFSSENAVWSYLLSDGEMDDRKQWAQSITADDVMRPREPDPFAEWAKRAAEHYVAIRKQCGDEEPQTIAVIGTDGSIYAMPDAEVD